MSKMKLTVQQLTHKSFVSRKTVAAFDEIIEFKSHGDTYFSHQLKRQDLAQIVECVPRFVNTVSSNLGTSSQAFLAAVEKGDVFLGNN
jgi:hypothetical protein